MKIRVYYEDTDAGGIVYHANYLKFCERARSEYFFQKNSSPKRGENHFVITRMEAKFLASAKLGDMLDVSVVLKELKRASFTLYQEVKREDTLLFSMEGSFVLTNSDGKPARLSEEDKKIFS